MVGIQLEIQGDWYHQANSNDHETKTSVKQTHGWLLLLITKSVIVKLVQQPALSQPTRIASLGIGAMAISNVASSCTEKEFYVDAIQMLSIPKGI